MDKSGNCGICNINIIRKGVTCSRCSKKFHSYCVDLPIVKTSFCCTDCLNSNSPEPLTVHNMDDDVQISIRKMMDDIAQLKVKQVEFAVSIKVFKKP